MTNAAEEIRYAAHPTLARFHASEAFVRGLVGPFRSGKTSACIHELIRRAGDQASSPRDGVRRTRMYVVRNTYRDLIDTTIKSWLEWFPAPLWGEYREHPYPGYLMRWVNADDGSHVECDVWFRALNRREHVRNLKSLEITGYWINEAMEVPKAIKDALDGRVGQYPQPRDVPATWAGGILDTNPPDTDHWWYRLFEERLPENHAIFHQPSGLAPNAENLAFLRGGRQYYTELSLGKTKEYVGVFVEGKYGFVMDGKPVYASYVPSLHDAPRPIEPVKGVDIISGMDWGLCYSEDTEVLTREGWKFFADVDPVNDVVATRNPLTKDLEYTAINFKTAEPYCGEMIEWASQSVNFCVTPAHRVPFTFRDSPDRVHFARADWLEAHTSGHHYVDLTASWSPGTDKSHVYGPHEWSGEVYATFMGIYLSEGSVDQGRTAITQKKPAGIAYIDAILSTTGLQWKRQIRHDGTVTWRRNDPALTSHLRAFGKQPVRYLPESIRFFPSAWIMRFLEAYTVGDGKVRTRPNGSHEHTIFTASHRLAGELQELALKVGWTTSMTWVDPTPSIIQERGRPPRQILGTGGYSIHFKKSLQRAELLPEHVRRVPYDGMIYCLNVPHHTLYVRRNGRPSWNGNTPATIWLQALPGNRVNFLRELCSVSMGAERHAEDMLAFERSQFPGQKVIKGFADPAGWTPAQTDEKTCVEICAAKGILLEPGAVAFAPRFEAMDSLLRRLHDGRGAVQIDPRCTTFKKALLGGYHFKRMRVPGKEDIFRDEPNKNHPYSDIANAAEYPISKLFDVAVVTRMETARHEESVRSRWREAHGIKPRTGPKRSWATR